MHASTRSSRLLQRFSGLRLLALLAIPALLLLHAPVLAALVPGALLTIASLTEDAEEPRALPSADFVRADDVLEIQRVATATMVTARSRRIG